MAATKRNAMLIDEARHYVYALQDANGTVVYVGKGSGYRLAHQKRRYGLAGCVLQWFKREREAYQFEVKAIAEHSPHLNKCKGGNGCRSAKRPRYRPDDREQLMAAIGTRAYAARLLLALPRHMIEASKLEALRAVAYGGRV